MLHAQKKVPIFFGLHQMKMKNNILYKDFELLLLEMYFMYN